MEKGLSFMASDSTVHAIWLDPLSALQDGERDALPEDVTVRIRFDGAGADAAGGVDQAELLVEGGSAADLAALPAGAIRFFRFEVEFQLDADGNGVEPQREAALEFLRLPFRF